MTNVETRKPFAVTSEIKLSGWMRKDFFIPKSDPDELMRVLCCDNQRGARGDIPHRIYSCCTFSAKGRMRVIDAGRVNEWAELRAKQQELGVPDPTEQKPGPWVLIDRRHDPVKVDEICAQYKWYGTMGYDSDEFVHSQGEFAGTRQLFSEPRLIDVGFGTSEMGRSFATYFLWSSQKIQDMLAQKRNDGLIEFPADASSFAPDIGTQMNSHRQFMETDRKNNEKRVWKRIGDTPDHIYDCVSQGMVVGCMAGIYRAP